MKSTLAILLTLSLSCFAAPLESSSSLSAPAQRASPYSADQLGAMYAKNAIAAGVKMEGQAITLTGTLIRIDASGALLESRGLDEIECVIAPDAIGAAAKLKARSHVVFTGTVGKYRSGMLRILDCRPAK